MKITILTLFPEMFDGFLNNSIIKRAISKGTVSFNIVNIRDYTLDKNNRVDTPPVGGGAGLIMKCQPIVDALRKTTSENSYKLLTSPKGTRFNQTKAKALAKLDDITIICGHYEGTDERINKYVSETKYTVSIGYSYQKNGFMSLDDLLKISDERMYSNKAEFYKNKKNTEH